MIVYLMRHGEAVSPSEWGRSDQTRPLTKRGIKEVEKALPEMKKAGFSVATLVASPYERARQTAELVANAFPLVSPKIEKDLAAGAPLETIRSVVNQHKSSTPLMLVGHMPEFSIFAARATEKPSMIENGLKPGEVVAMESPDDEFKWGRAKLLWCRRLDEWNL